MTARSRSTLVRSRWTGGLAAAAIAFAACSSSASTAPGSSTTAQATATEAPTQPAATTTASVPELTEAPATGVPTAIDPCTLVTQSEASTLAGTTFAAGKETTTSGNGKICTYGGQTTNVMTVSTAVAPDQATLTADENAFRSQLAKAVGKGLTAVDLSGIGDSALWLSAKDTVSGVTVNVEAIYVIKGLTFFGISDVVVNSAPPSQADMETQATTTLGRIP